MEWDELSMKKKTWNYVECDSFGRKKVLGKYSWSGAVFFKISCLTLYEVYVEVAYIRKVVVSSNRAFTSRSVL